ncbi:MAG TPA: NFACT RNA binding domain-containing protein [Patescibacteria group bacterium]|nr:NFACT RNA binding domain-containing protein [Patescibacteria group bacterium]
MDLPLLQAVVAEAAVRLTEQELIRVGFLGRHRYLLRFATLERDNLLVSLRADQPRLHLTPLGVGSPESPPDRFAALVDRELAGARLAGMEVRGGDRVVALRFGRTPGSPAGTPRTLMVELFGRSANALLLDGDGIVLGTARDFEGARGAATGAPYQPRPPRESDREAEQGAPGPVIPTIYSVRPLGEFSEGTRVDRHDLILSVSPQVPPPRREGDGEPMLETRFASASAAAQTAFDLLERLRDFDEGRTLHLTRIRKEIGRLASLERRLGEDLDAAAATDRDRRRAEALLAGLAHAKISGSEATVGDPESPEGSPMTIPIDPGLSLADNAARLFTRWKKGKRAISAIATRRETVRARLAAWQAVERQASGAASLEDLRLLRVAMERLGLVHAEKPARRALSAAPPGPPTRVRRHTTADGFVVLVGRSGPENDTLTFKVASPWDFWMHAAGTPGAHVVIRNPQRLKSLPDRTLAAAAAIAAWYSGAKSEGKVEVHYTQRKHVHKRRGMPAGQVLVRRFRSIQVAPRLPQTAIEDV